MMRAFRVLSSAPLLSCAVVLLLAVGIASNALVSGAADALLRRPFSVADPGRLYALTRDTPGAPVSNALYEALRHELSPTLDLAAFAATGAPVRGSGPATDVVVSVQASRNYFDVVRPPFLMGRGFSNEAGLPEVVISRAFWVRGFASHPDVLGATLHVHQQPLVIVGVLDGFSGTSVTYDADVFHPFDLAPALLGRELGGSLLAPGTRLASVLGRSSQDVRLNVINRQVRSADQRMKAALGENRASLEAPLVVVPASDTAVRGEARANVLRLGTLAALVSFGIFVLACMNASALVLARLDRRRHALAIRRALGASRWQVVRAGLAEVAVLASLGLVLGLVAAVLGERALNASGFAVTGQVPLRVSLSGPVVALSGVLAACAVLITGLLPMWHASRSDVTSVLGAVATRTIAGGRLVGRRSFIAVQVAAAITLTVLTLVTVKGLRDAGATDFGFDATSVLQANIDLSLPSLQVDNPDKMFRQLRERASELPGVGMAGLADAAPLSGGLSRRPIDVNGEVITVHAVGAGLGYFEALGIPLLAGSLPAEGERDAVVISESLAQQLRSRGAGLGSVVRIADDGPDAGLVRVVGIVREVHQAVPGDTPLPVMYLRAEHETPARRSATLLLRTSGRRDVHLQQVRALVGELSPEVPVWRLQWLSEPVRAWLMPVRALSAVLVVSGGIALLLALSGIYALLVYLVSGRRRELGIRMALGATPNRAYHAVVSGVTFAALIGLAVGAIAGWGASHTLARAFVSVKPADPTVLLLASGLIGTLLGAGLLVPGSAVRRIVPASVLRDE